MEALGLPPAPLCPTHFFQTQCETTTWNQTQTVCVMRTNNETSSPWSQSRMATSCAAIRDVLGRWPVHSQTLWSPLTKDRRLPVQPQVAPVHAGQGVLGWCVLSVPLPCCLKSHAIMRVRSPSWRAIAVQRRAKRQPPPPICVIRRWDVHVSDHHSSTNSLQMRAMMLPNAYPHRPSIPASAHAA